MTQAAEDAKAMPELAGLPAGRGQKRYTSGTHRVVSPEETVDRIIPLMPKIGITRLADLTGLDRLRVPVFAAYRPNSRSLAVFQGKGVTPAAAKASALMEATETFCAEMALPPLRLARTGEVAALGIVADTATLPRVRRQTLQAHEPILWTTATDIVTAAPVFLPFEIVHADYTAATPANSGIFAANTNGLASGNDFFEAVAHALYELVERDAIALWSLSNAMARAARVLDLGSVGSPICRDLLRQFDDAAIDVAVWDITTDIGLPAFHCLIADRDASATDPEIGSGCHPSREVALMRALSEAVQSRATWIAGSRDDFEPRDYLASARAGRLATSRDWLNAPPRVDFGAVPDWINHCVRDDIAQAVTALRRVGLAQVLAVDLTHPDIGVPVARVVVPGLEGVYNDAGFMPGQRGLDLLALQS